MSTGSRRRAFPEDRHRRAVFQRLVKAALVVEGDPFANSRPSFEPVGVAFQIDVLVLQRAPEAFDEDVVHPAAAAVHRDADAGFDQHAREGRSGELAALVGVEDLGPAVPGQRLLQGLDARHEASIVFDSRQDSTARLAQSMTATR